MAPATATESRLSCGLLSNKIFTVPPDEHRGADLLPQSIANAKFDLQRMPTDSSLSRLESRGTFRRDDGANDGGVVVVEHSSVRDLAGTAE